MNKLCLVFLGALLCALHLASQVQAQGTTKSPHNATWSPMNSTMAGNTTMHPHNMTTGNSTKDKSAGDRTEMTALLLLLALGFLHGCS